MTRRRPRIACQRWQSADAPQRPRRRPTADDEACGEFVRRWVRSFRQLVRNRGPRVTWAGMARSPMRLPRRPADSPALPLQHTHRYRPINSVNKRVTLSRVGSSPVKPTYGVFSCPHPVGGRGEDANDPPFAAKGTRATRRLSRHSSPSVARGNERVISFFSFFFSLFFLFSRTRVQSTVEATGGRCGREEAYSAEVKKAFKRDARWMVTRGGSPIVVLHLPDREEETGGQGRTNYASWVKSHVYDDKGAGELFSDREVGRRRRRTITTKRDTVARRWSTRAFFEAYPSGFWLDDPLLRDRFLDRRASTTVTFR